MSLKSLTIIINITIRLLDSFPRPSCDLSIQHYWYEPVLGVRQFVNVATSDNTTSMFPPSESKWRFNTMLYLAVMRQATSVWPTDCRNCCRVCLCKQLIVVTTLSPEKYFFSNLFVSKNIHFCCVNINIKNAILFLYLPYSINSLTICCHTLKEVSRALFSTINRRFTRMNILFIITLGFRP